MVPSDVAVALGAFLSHGGTTRPLTVFLIAWVSNTAGAMLVYFLVRRSREGFLGLPLIRSLMAPRAVAVIERDYLRLGIVGLMVARLLPGIRSVVPPFAGMFRIPVWRVFLVVATVSAAWYAGITWIGAVAGTEFDRVKDLLHQMGRTTALIGAALAIILALAIYSRRRRREEPVVEAVRSALGGDDPERPIDPQHAAQLVLELAYADAGLGTSERARVEADLRARWGLPPRAATPTATQVSGEGDGNRLVQFGRRLRDEFGRERRLALVEQMWQSIFADRSIDAEQEKWLLERSSELLGLAPEDVARVRSQPTTHDPRPQ